MDTFEIFKLCEGKPCIYCARLYKPDESNTNKTFSTCMLSLTKMYLPDTLRCMECYLKHEWKPCNCRFMYE